MTVKRTFSLVGLLVCLLFLPGCWDYEKVNDRTQVSAIGIEPVEGNPKLLSYTIQVPLFATADATGASKGVENQSGFSAYHNYTVVSRSLNDAISQVQTQSDKGLYLGNAEVILYNTRLSHTQIRRATAEFIRTPDVEKLAYVLFTTQSPKDVLEAKTNFTPPDTIARIFSTSVKQHGYAIRTHLWEFWRDAMNVGRQPYAGRVETTDSGIQVGGLVIPTDEDTCVDLTPRETIYFNLIARSIHNLSMTIMDGEQSFEAGQLKSKSKLSVLAHEGRVNAIQVRIRVTGIVLQDESDGTTPLSNPELHRYERVMAADIEANAMKVINKLQQNKADAFDLGENIITKNPRLAQYVKNEWPDDFAKVKPDIKVVVHLKAKGTLM